MLLFLLFNSSFYSPSRQTQTKNDKYFIARREIMADFVSSGSAIEKLDVVCANTPQHLHHEVKITCTIVLELINNS